MTVQEQASPRRRRGRRGVRGQRWHRDDLAEPAQRQELLQLGAAHDSSATRSSAPRRTTMRGSWSIRGRGHTFCAGADLNMLDSEFLGTYDQLDQDRPGLRAHVRPRVQSGQADDRRRRGLRGRRRLRAVDLVRLPDRRRRREDRRLPHPPRPVRRRRPDLPPAALHRPAQDQGAPVHRQAAVGQGVLRVGAGQRVGAGRADGSGDRRLRRADARQERVHDADHEDGRQPGPRRRHRDADRAREHDVQRRAPVRGCEGGRAGVPREARSGLEAPLGIRGPDRRSPWTSPTTTRRSSSSERLLAFMDECVYPAERAVPRGGGIRSMTGGGPHRSSRS